MAFALKQGDSRPFLAVQLLKEVPNRPPLDLTNASTVTFKMKSGGGALVVNAPAVFVDRAQGKVEYRWAPTDTATVGNYRGEFEIAFADGTIQSVPTVGFIDLVVSDDLD